MTIDEAIIQFREYAESDREFLDFEWAEEDEQVASWLEELKKYRKIGTPQKIIKDRIKTLTNIPNFYYVGKRDGIDIFVDKCVEFEDITFNREQIERIKLIAEQLKEKNNK